VPEKPYRIRLLVTLLDCEEDPAKESLRLRVGCADLHKSSVIQAPGSRACHVLFLKVPHSVFFPLRIRRRPDRQALAMHHRYCEPLLCVPAYRRSKLISAMFCPVTNTMFWYRAYAPPVPQSNGYPCSWWPPGFTDSTNIDPPRVFAMQFIPGTSSCRDLEGFSHGRHERGRAHGRGGGGSRGSRGMIYPAWHNIP
jgi:hypothetical protein